MADYDSDTELSLSLSLSLSSSSSRKAQRTGLPDDVILEIIARLPLHKMVQCSLLNKTLHHSVSHPQFLLRHRHAFPVIFNCSAAEPKLYTGVFHTEFTSRASVLQTLEIETIILASCGGLLLLRLSFQRNRLHIFNPITGAIMPLDLEYSKCVPSRFGLAVDPDVAGASFKVVEMDVETTWGSDQSILEFNVFVPSQDGLSMCLESSTQILVGRSMANHFMRPVYRAGTMYWLGDNGGTMVAFDMKKKHVTITHGPLSGENRTGDKWFGSASGSIRFVHATQEEILIYGLDEKRGEWRVDQRIEYAGRLQADEYGQTCYFDGGRLFFLVRTIGGNGAIRVYDVGRKEWGVRQCVFSGWGDAGQLFLFFSPTMVKVSNIYLRKLEETEQISMSMKMKMANHYCWIEANMDGYYDLRDTFVLLQRLLRSPQLTN